ATISRARAFAPPCGRRKAKIKVKRSTTIFDHRIALGGFRLGSSTRGRSRSARALLAPSKFYGQAERAISTGKLRSLRSLHLQPIKHVVFVCPSYPACAGLGDLILRSASRLYAFSVYHHRTSLPSRAIGMTAGTQEVRPSRSSRTKDRS